MGKAAYGYKMCPLQLYMIKFITISLPYLQVVAICHVSKVVLNTGIWCGALYQL